MTKRCFLKPLILLVPPGGLEPPTNGLEGRCSILLSYGGKPLFILIYQMGNGKGHSSWGGEISGARINSLIFSSSSGRSGSV